MLPRKIPVNFRGKLIKKNKKWSKNNSRNMCKKKSREKSNAGLRKIWKR